METTNVIVSSWWLAAPQPEAWQLISEVRRWSGWWRSVEKADVLRKSQEFTVPEELAWRAIIGRPLRIQVLPISQQVGSMIEYIIHGDLCGRATWLFSAGTTEGTEITCRWEFAHSNKRNGWHNIFIRFLFER